MIIHGKSLINPAASIGASRACFLLHQFACLLCRLDVEYPRVIEGVVGLLCKCSNDFIVSMALLNHLYNLRFTISNKILCKKGPSVSSHHDESLNFSLYNIINDQLGEANLHIYETSIVLRQ